MTKIRAFDGFLVKESSLQTVVSPAYDSLIPEDRRSFSLSHPLNYINAMHSQDEYPEERRPTLAEVLDMNAANLEKMMDRGDFEALEQPAIFIYRLAVDGHQQTAVVCEIPIDHYDTGMVLKHEHTRSDKEDLLTQYLDVVGASSSPVCLAYKENNEIIDLMGSFTADAPPLYSFSAHDAVEQTLWRIDNEHLIRRFQELFSKVDKTYLTDGHHRFAAGSRFARRRRSRNPAFSEDDKFNYVLVALFPAHQLRILPFNRCVRDLNGMSADQFLSRLAESFIVEPVKSTSAAPHRKHQFGMYLQNEWYRLTLQTAPGAEQDPVQGLDVTILQEQILNPILGITDVRNDDRLGYIAGDVGLAGIQMQSKRGWAVGFACYPTSIDELIQVAESGEVMPPKSTYFDPKMRSGIFLRLY